MSCGTITKVENLIKTACVFDQGNNGRMSFRPVLKQNISGTSSQAVGNRNNTLNATLTNL